MPKQSFDYALDIATLDRGWLQIEALEALIEGAVLSACEALGTARAGELSVALVSDAEIQALNQNYRQKDKPTNVLSFPAGIEGVLGDIIVARETVLAEARTKHIAPADHLRHLIIHGYLHLCGFDHENDADAAVMEALEIKALARLGLSDPYRASPDEEYYV